MKKLLICLFTAMCFAFAAQGQTLNFDEPFETRSWTEDGHSWSWDNSGWDNIKSYKPHTGSGHGMSAPGYHSKLSSGSILNIQGLRLKTDFASGFTHLHLKGYINSRSLICPGYWCRLFGHQSCWTCTPFGRVYFQTCSGYQYCCLLSV